MADPYDRAPCGLLTTDAHGTILSVNQTLLDWLGFTREELLGREFVDLLSGGGRIYHETHYAPLLLMQGTAREIAFDLRGRNDSRLPVLVNARRYQHGDDVRIHVAVFDATERRMYERELLIAKDNAERSEARARVLARTLQSTLLPAAVPSVAGLDLAAVYLPAGEGHEIGGDFYDMFQIGVDDWVIALGDVEGKGVEAAIVTALVRYTIRAASVEHEPARVLRIVNDVLLRDATERYCTAVVMRCRRHGSEWTVTVACGGHPLPILAGDSTSRAVGRPGPLIGFFDAVQFENVDVPLSDRDLLVAYTDGVTEARRGRSLLGDEQVAALLARAGGQPTRAVLDELVQAALRYGGTPNRDDIAAVAIRPA